MKKIVAGSLPLLLTVSGVAQDAEKATHTD